MRALVAAVLLIVASPAIATEMLLGVRGNTVFVFDPSSGSAEALATVPVSGPLRVAAQDRAGHRLFLESFDASNAPFYFRLWVMGVRPAQLTPTSFRAQSMLQYFYDDLSGELYALGQFLGQYQILRIDIQTGSTSSVFTLPSSAVLYDSWRLASFDPSLNRVYLSGVVDARAEFTQKALFAVNLDSKTLTRSPFLSWDALSFLPHSSGGELYARAARGVSSEIQEIIRINAERGTSESVVQNFPLRFTVLIASNPDSGHVFLRAYDDGRIFVADLNTHTIAPAQHAISGGFVEFAPFVLDIFVSVPALGTWSSVFLVALLGVSGIGLIALRDN